MSDFIKILIVCFVKVVLDMGSLAIIVFVRNKFYEKKHPGKKSIEISQKEILLYSIMYLLMLISIELFAY